jgi:serine/threonine protein kinase
MAEVFLAVKTGPDGFERRVALKRILPHLSESPEFRTMFLDEARLAARLSHPHVVQVFDFGKVDDYSFIVMELVDGVDVGRLVEQPAGKTATPVPFAIAARIFADVASGLAHAHGVGLVHRDVTPQNLLVSYDGIVKIVDFGIAKAAWQIGHTKPGVVKGKFAYLSPEQVDGRVLDGRSDVFSLGICLWETLTGAPLFRRDDARAAMRQIREGNGASFAAAARRRRPDLPEALERILSRALAIDVDERYEAAAERQEELERYVKSAAELATARKVGAFVSAVAPKVPLPDDEPAEDGTARVSKVPEQLPDSGSDETELSPPPPNAQIHPVLSPAPAPSEEAPPSVLVSGSLSVHDAPTKFSKLPPSEGGDDATIVSVEVPGEVPREVLAAERARATAVNLEAGAAATEEPKKGLPSVEQRRARRAAEARPDHRPPGAVTDPVPVDELLADEGAAALEDAPGFSQETTLSLDDEPRPGDLTGTALTPPPTTSAAAGGDDTSASTRVHLPFDRASNHEPSVTPPTPPSQSSPTPPRGTALPDGEEGRPLGTGILSRALLGERAAITALVAVTLILVVTATVGLMRRSRTRTIDDLDPVTPAAAPPIAVPAPTLPPTTTPAPGPPGALVDVLSRPEGARVVVDGEPLATTPARGLALVSGSHEVSVELPAHRPRRMNIIVAAGERRTIDVELAATHRPKPLKHR